MKLGKLLIIVVLLLFSSCSLVNEKTINSEELKEIENKNYYLLLKVNSFQGEYIIVYNTLLSYSQIGIFENLENYKVITNKFVKFKDAKKLEIGTNYNSVIEKFGTPLLFDTQNEYKKIAYFQRSFSFTKGFYLSSHVIILEFNDDKLESLKEEYFFRP